MSKHKHTKTHK